VERRAGTKDYEADVERNLEDLHGPVQRGAYRALPSRRVYIPKPDGRQRPLAVAALEDKIVQRAVTALLSAIYEEDFLGFSYGFRPWRGAHNALDALCVGIHGKKVSFMLDADIRSFFDEISQDWLIRFLEHRIGDRRIIRLVQKWLKAGILEDRVVSINDRGTGQGSVISPLLANIYLHYALDLWAMRWRMTWERMTQLVDAWLPKPIILHPWPSDRFAVTHPRWETYAGKPPVRFCAGGAR
jgi:RNA-directed DNA polymerase